LSKKLFEFPKLYTEFAKYYDRLESQYRDHAKEANWLLQIFEENRCKRIVDMSCGTGSHLAQLMKKEENISDRTYTGMDASKEMVFLAVEKLGLKNAEKILLSQADFLHPPFREKSFDAAICMYWSLAGLNETLVKDLFVSVNSVLRKGGLFVFDTENAGGIKENLLNSPFIDAFFPVDQKDAESDAVLIRANFSRKIEADLVDWHAYYLQERHGVSELQTDRMKLRFYSREQLENLLSLTGFRIVDVYSGPFMPYLKGSPSLYFQAKKE
jgi:SAM-dependent methyltransferase